MFANYKGNPKTCSRCGLVTKSYAPSHHSKNLYRLSIKQKVYMREHYRLCGRCWCGFVNANKELIHKLSLNQTLVATNMGFR